MKMKFSFLVLCCIYAIGAFSQNIKGSVKSKSGKGIAFANVSVLNSFKNTLTDQQGNFSVRLPEGAYTIFIDATGYTSLTRQVKSPSQSDPIEIKLDETIESFQIR